MTEKDIKTILRKGEGLNVEFKSSFNTEVIETLVAFSNTSGGTVLIGISNESKLIGVSINSESIQVWLNEIKNKTSPSIIPDAEIITIRLKKIVVFSIQEFPIKPVALKGKYYKRVANSNHMLSTSEVVNMHLQSFNTSWDYHTNSQFSIKDLSLEKVQNTIDRLNQTGDHVIEEPSSFLRKSDLVREGLITNAAYLMFKKEDSVLTTIELGRFQTETIIKDSARTKADILTQIDQVMDFVRKHINKEVIITGDAQNTQRWEYPLEAIREIVMNMIVHRDYRSASDSIVKIFNNKIEFYNPGRLPENITVEDLLSNNYISTPRNKLIADFCKNLGLIEKYGSGIRRIVEYFEAENFPLPEFRNISDGFMVTIFGKDTDDVLDRVTDKVTDRVTDKVTDNQKKIIDYLKENDRISTSEIAQKIGISQRKVKENIRKLKETGLLIRIGSEKNGHWQVIEKK